MTHPPPPGWPGWPPPSPVCPMNGQAYDIAHALGGLQAESRRQTEILLGLQERIINLPHELADAIRSAPAAASVPAGSTTASPPSAAPPPPSPPPSTLQQWLLAATMIGGLAAALAGKLDWATLFELLRKLQGLP